MKEDQSYYGEMLPSVEGRLDCSIANFEHRGQLALREEQSKVSPNNWLIALLCDGVRLAREYRGPAPTRTIDESYDCPTCHGDGRITPRPECQRMKAEKLVCLNCGHGAHTPDRCLGLWCTCKAGAKPDMSTAVLNDPFTGLPSTDPRDAFSYSEPPKPEGPSDGEIIAWIATRRNIQFVAPAYGHGWRVTATDPMLRGEGYPVAFGEGTTPADAIRAAMKERG